MGIDPDSKIEITLSGNLKDVGNIRKQLKTYRLDIGNVEAEGEVLVIRDK